MNTFKLFLELNFHFVSFILKSHQVPYFNTWKLADTYNVYEWLALFLQGLSRYKL